MNLIEVLSILLIHWFADFVLQTDEQAKGKSKEWKPLLMHVANYSVVWMLIGFILIPTFLFPNVILFGIITFICHIITDYFTSRLNSKLYSQGKTHSFFVSIGFDQWLHYLQLFLTYWYLTR